MALDSATKRQAVPGVGRPWLRSQMRDASKAEPWRVSVGNAYPVAAFASPIAEDPSPEAFRGFIVNVNKLGLR